MKTGAIFYNIGRGSTVVQGDLLEALLKNKLQAAYLDVTDPEPLPPEHPLWLAANCHITPHTAGGHEGEFREVVRHFLENLRRFENGMPLIDRIM
jgi:phosphoglycerate dehydrogenase-like enzyme